MVKKYMFLLTIMLLHIKFKHSMASCPLNCNCNSVSGYISVKCIDNNLTSIPEEIDDATQYLDLSNNTLLALEHDSLKKSNIINLKELLLTHNEIKRLAGNTFSDNVKLTSLHLNDNLLETLEDDIFSGLTDLIYINLQNNCINKIGMKTFQNLTKLKDLNLSENKLTKIHVDSIRDLHNLKKLIIYNNLWVCDCKLEAFRLHIVDHKYNISQFSCNSPNELINSRWDDKPFGCKPNITSLTFNINNETQSATLTCITNGDPSPVNKWMHNSIHNANYSIIDNESKPDKFQNNTLTIYNISNENNGNYTCTSENLSGVDEKTVYLNVTQYIFNINVPEIILISEVDLWIILIIFIFALFITSISLIAYCNLTNKGDDDENDSKSYMRSANVDSIIERKPIISQYENNPSNDFEYSDFDVTKLTFSAPITVKQNTHNEYVMIPLNNIAKSYNSYSKL